MKYAHVQATRDLRQSPSAQTGRLRVSGPSVPRDLLSQYAGHGFDTETHLKLKALCRDYDHRDVKWMMSNSDCPDTDRCTPSSPSVRDAERDGGPEQPKPGPNFSSGTTDELYISIHTRQFVWADTVLKPR